MHHCKALSKPVSIEFHRPEHLYRGVTTKCVQAGARGGGGRGVLPITALGGSTWQGSVTFLGFPVYERVENQRHLQIPSWMLADNCLICRLGAQSMIFKSNVKITVPDLPSPLASLFCAADAFWVTRSEERN